MAERKPVNPVDNVVEKNTEILKILKYRKKRSKPLHEFFVIFNDATRGWFTMDEIIDPLINERLLLQYID